MVASKDTTVRDMLRVASDLIITMDSSTS